MTPIPGRCSRCDSEFPLVAVVEEGTGACPQCLQPLVAGDPGALLEWAAVADAAHYRLSAAIHLLQQVDGHLIVDWPTVLEALAEDADRKTLGLSEPGNSMANGAGRPESSPRWREVAQLRRVGRAT